MRLRTHRLWLASLLLAAGLSVPVGAKPPDLPVQTEDQFAGSPKAEAFTGGALIIGGIETLYDTEECEPTIRVDQKCSPGVIGATITIAHQAINAVKSATENKQKPSTTPNCTEGCMPCRPGCPATGEDPHRLMQRMIPRMQPFNTVLDDEVTRALMFKMFEQAQSYINAGQYPEALQIYAAIRCTCPNTPYETQAIGCMNALSVMMSEKTDSSEASEPKPVPAPTKDDCPYLRKKIDRPIIEKAKDKDECGTVAENIAKMEKAAQMYKKAEHLMHEGDSARAAVYYQRISNLVPGSRYDQMAKDRLARLNPPAPDVSEVEEVPLPATGDSEDSSIEGKESRLEKNLERLVSVNIYQKPLDKCVADLRKMTGIQIEADKNALNEENIPVDLPVFVDMTDVPVREVINKLCKTTGLAWVVKDGSLILTSRRVAAGPVVTACYDVTDLIQVKASKKGGRRKPQLSEEAQAKKLMKVITDAVQPETWADRGGIGSIEYFPLTRSIVVNHTASAQEQVEEMLGRLRSEPTLLKPRVVKAPGNPVDTAVWEAMEEFWKACECGDEARKGAVGRQLLRLHLQDTAPCFGATCATPAPTVKMVAPQLPPIDPTIVQAYEQILEMAPARTMRFPFFDVEVSEPPMSWVPLKPLTPNLAEEDIQKLTLKDTEEELEVVTEDGAEASEPAPAKDKTSSTCIDLDLNNAKGKRFKIQLQMGKMTLRMVRDAQGKGNFTIDYSIIKE